MAEWDFVVDTDKTEQCPACGDEHVHMVGVRMNEGGRITTLGPGTREESIGAPSGRGSSIAVRFQCEEGHAFVVAFQFHKGIVYRGRRREPARDRPVGEVSGLWRD